MKTMKRKNGDDGMNERPKVTTLQELPDAFRKAAMAAAELCAVLKSFNGVPISYMPQPKVACGIVIHRGIFAE